MKGATLQGGEHHNISASTVESLQTHMSQRFAQIEERL